MDNQLSEKISILKEIIDSKPIIYVFYRDVNKSEQSIAVGAVEHIDEEGQYLLLSSGIKIPFANIYEIGGDIFRK